MKTSNQCKLWILFAITGMLVGPLPVSAQEHGSGGGGVGCGDVFGDLIHILRDETTGQPILAQRWIEMPAELQGYGWGYCPIAVYHDDDGYQYELPFQPFSCDFDVTNPDDPANPLAVEEVNYFGRLNGGRTKERNNRMHFNEVISNIKQADTVMVDATGRLKLGFDCGGIGSTACYEYATVDSPMESIGLYVRLMKYGHIATDPYEIDAWAHGDPKMITQFNPALDVIEMKSGKVDVTDFDKFGSDLDNLLPDPGQHGVAKLEDCWDFEAAEDFVDSNTNDLWDPGEPFFDMNENCEWDEDSHEPFEDLDGDGVFDPAETFTDDNGNCVRDEFEYLCAGPEALDADDFTSAAVLLAAAANKTGNVTVDLVQYFNRFLKITKETDYTVATENVLPARVRDCYPGDGNPFAPGWEPSPDDDESFYGACDTYDADGSLPNYDKFPDVREEFVDFGAVNYGRNKIKGKVDVILDEDRDTTWDLAEKQSLLEWVEFVNGPSANSSNINGFVDSAEDFLRSIEYVHNFAPPEYLHCVYVPEYCQ